MFHARFLYPQVPIDGFKMTKKNTSRLENPALGDGLLLEYFEDRIASLTLNRPESRNSLSIAMLDGLADAFTRLSENPDVKVIILQTNGPVFCAGHDLKELTGKQFSNYMIFLEKPKNKVPAPKKVSIDVPNNHLKYAITWYSIAISILFYYLYFRRKK